MNIDTETTKVLLDCNVWMDAVGRDRQVPKTAAALGKSELGHILNAALRGKKVRGKPMTIVVSRHVMLTCDHVCAKRGWSKPGEVNQWIIGLLGHLNQLGSVVFDDTREDYSALSARAGKADGVEDAEDEAVLRAVLDNNAILVTNDWAFAGAAGRRGARVMGPAALIAALDGR